MFLLSLKLDKDKKYYIVLKFTINNNNAENNNNTHDFNIFY